jgi:putative inorganic carbon (HCO3(-)) transporter
VPPADTDARPWTFPLSGHSMGRLIGVASVSVFRPLHALLSAPGLLFLVTLAILLFRPPDLDLHQLDRIAFCLLIFVIALRALLLRQALPWVSSVTVPMAGLLSLALASAASQPYNAQTWSLLAAKFLVPFVLFHLAILAFASTASIRRFEIFCLVVLAYLTLVAIASLAGATFLIFPRYILDVSLGIHADRARGPFLQAVANGVTLNLLGLLALDRFRRQQLGGITSLLLFSALPVAILATMTRAVWLSFVISILLLVGTTRCRRVRGVCLGLLMTGAAGLLLILASGELRTALDERLQERSPVEFRAAIYQVGWEMFLEKPLLGWGQNRMPAAIAQRMSDYRPETYCAHNSYLEILVEQGVVGFGLYLWMVTGLLRLGQRMTKAERDPVFGRVWPILLVVYFLNASFVVINYQFVNALLFTIGGILAGQGASPSDEYLS